MGNVIGTTLSMFNDLVAWKSASVLTKATSTAQELMQAGREISSLEDLNNLTNLCNKVGVEVEVSLGDLSAPWVARAPGAAAQLIEDADLMVTRWTRIANVADALAKGFSIALLAAGCVISGLQIKDDFSSGQPPLIKALDILSEISMGVAFLASAGAAAYGLLSTEVHLPHVVDRLLFISFFAQVLTVVPVIGEVAAVVGVVVAIVTIFIHRKPPPSPAEVFVTDHCVPFVKELTSPPQKWLDEQKNVDDHLDDKTKK